MMELHSDLRRQQGRWNNTAMDKCYSNLPLPAIRALAGFSGLALSSSSWNCQTTGRTR
jgi:hypothetical protein